MSNGPKQTRVGIYAWGGPGTVRLLRTKYHEPKIENSEYLRMYDRPYLEKLKSLFGVTDAWVTYSWGFSDRKEEEDYAFLRSKLKNFQSLGIRTHAYVQGLNVVTQDFIDDDIFCKDGYGQLIPYSKGRSFICPNNPSAYALVAQRVEKACKEKVDGIFIDNVLFGLPPFQIKRDYLPFFGCSCVYCQSKFKQNFGYSLPIFEKKDNEIRDYLEFRSQSIRDFLQGLAATVHKYTKEFSINLYDPTIRSDSLFYGYDLQKIEPFIDYLLIENHSLPSAKGVNNTHLDKLLKDSKKSVFVVSYKRGIGFEEMYTQHDIDALFSESRELGYSPCIKCTEFTVNGKWLPLDLRMLSKPSMISLTKTTKPLLVHDALKSTFLSRLFMRILGRSSTTLLTLIQEKKLVNKMFFQSKFAENALKVPRLYRFP